MMDRKPMTINFSNKSQTTLNFPVFWPIQSMGSLPARGGGKERFICCEMIAVGFPCGSAGKESACNAEDLASIPE